MAESNIIGDMIKEQEGTPEWHMADMQFDIAEAIDNKLDGRPRAWLARRMGVNRAWIHRIMSLQENLTLLSLARIGKALGIKWKLIPTADERPLGRENEEG